MQTEIHKIPFKRKKKPPLLWKWLNIVMHCPGMLWSLHPSRYSKPNWTWSWAPCSRWTCFEQEGWAIWFPEVPSHDNDTVILTLLISHKEHSVLVNGTEAFYLMIKQQIIWFRTKLRYLSITCTTQDHRQKNPKLSKIFKETRKDLILVYN